MIAIRYLAGAAGLEPATTGFGDQEFPFLFMPSQPINSHFVEKSEGRYAQPFYPVPVRTEELGSKAVAKGIPALSRITSGPPWCWKHRDSPDLQHED